MCFGCVASAAACVRSALCGRVRRCGCTAVSGPWERPELRRARQSSGYSTRAAGWVCQPPGLRKMASWPRLNYAATLAACNTLVRRTRMVLPPGSQPTSPSTVTETTNAYDASRGRRRMPALSSRNRPRRTHASSNTQRENIRSSQLARYPRTPARTTGTARRRRRLRRRRRKAPRPRGRGRPASRRVVCPRCRR